MDGGAGGIAPWYSRQLQLTQSCRTDAAPGNHLIHGTGIRHHGHVGMGDMVRHACCRLQRGVSEAELCEKIEIGIRSEPQQLSVSQEYLNEIQNYKRDLGRLKLKKRGNRE